jgi:hypothetical protein
MSALGQKQTFALQSPSFVTCIGDDIEQLFNTIASDRCNNAKLGKMGTDRVHHCASESRICLK